MTDFNLLLGKGNKPTQSPYAWGKPCECCKVKPASAVCTVCFQSRYGPKPRILRLCAQCSFTGAALKWSGAFYDEEAKEIVGRPKVLSVKLISSITRFKGA